LRLKSVFVSCWFNFDFILKIGSKKWTILYTEYPRKSNMINFIF